MKQVTLLFLLSDNQVLLAMKKRGFGQGKWNGVGGKVEEGEHERDAAIRECKEEIGVTPHEPRLVGRLHFYELRDPDFHHYCHIFVADSWEGEPVETEEMRPRWFHQTGLPYGSMWPDDVLWLPHLLSGRSFEGTITLDGDVVHHHDLTITTRSLA
ncbi:8-oxo-dGTP diphosphatase [Candidatus Saccharibacteria bacterium]|nr:8-oxo-dGTP diphosphatase [Candidatus Saccharibacteria bacterium]